ncbi:hypothetical protein TWF173_010622 [Orbilia oligospora]|nr:hypothetical protein TWF173_010622 [Orbilia oligospora]
MQFTTAALTVFAAVAGVVSAQPPPPPPPPTHNLDGPFALQLRGPHVNWNDKFLSHVPVGGTANLVIPENNSVNFYLNTTDKTLVYIAPRPRPGPPGGFREQYPFVVVHNLVSNVGGIYIADDSVQGTSGWSFSQQGILELAGFSNRFHICTHQTPAGPRSGLAWQYGAGRFDVPDCSPVAIRRVNVPRGFGGPGGPRGRPQM